MAEVEKVDLHYDKINKQKKITHLEEQLVDARVKERRIENEYLANKEILKKKEIKYEIDLTENKNLRKAVEELNVKNMRLRDKLNAIGISKVPTSELERKVLFTQNDKDLETCSLIHDVHGFTKNLLELPVNTPSRENLASLKRGSLSHCIEDLRL